MNAGAYLLTPDIFKHLETAFRANHSNELMYVKINLGWDRGGVGGYEGGRRG